MHLLVQDDAKVESVRKAISIWSTNNNVANITINEAGRNVCLHLLYTRDDYNDLTLPLPRCQGIAKVESNDKIKSERGCTRMTNDFFYAEDERIGKRVENKNQKERRKWHFLRIPCLPRGVVKIRRGSGEEKILQHDTARSCSN